jgi:ribosomal protein S24E
MCCIGFIFSCQKEDIIEPQSIDIFKVKQSTLVNRNEITFNVEKEGVFIVTMIDKNTNQVVSREKIKCIIGKNKIKVYTKTIPSRYLYLKLEDSFNNQLGNTIIIVK